MNRIKFKNYAGFRLNGNIPMPKPKRLSSSHISRASFLTAQVESGGKFGTVISYDGTGMTAGIHQAVAVYPANMSDGDLGNDQGPLWELLWQLKTYWDKFCRNTAPFPETPSSPNYSWPEFEAALKAEGFLLASSGLFHLDTKKRVSGPAIRACFTGSSDGVAPTAGHNRKMAEFWVEEFHKLFSSSWTFETQLDFGDRFFSMQTVKRLRFCVKKSLQELTLRDYLYSSAALSMATVHTLGAPLDLALSIYWSNSVNAPGYALKVLCKVADKHPSVREAKFAPALINALGNASYGRWDDDIPNGRYQRTRTAAMEIWPKELFEGPNAIMPKDLVG